MDDGNEIIPANWPNDKHIICTTNNKITSHPYVLVNRSVLCNCSIKADNHYLLESLPACHNRHSKLTMYFIINTALATCLDMFPNITESLQTPLIRNRTMYEQILPIHLSFPGFDNMLCVSTNLKDFIKSNTMTKEIFDLQERRKSTILNTSKNFF